MQHFAYFLEKLRNTPDGDGSLLDHSMFVYGSGISDGNIHFHLDLPMVVVGGGAGTLQGGRHLRYATTRRLATCMWRCSTSWALPMDQFGDSTGQLDYLSGSRQTGRKGRKGGPGRQGGTVRKRLRPCRAEEPVLSEARHQLRTRWWGPAPVKSRLAGTSGGLA